MAENMRRKSVLGINNVQIVWYTLGSVLLELSRWCSTLALFLLPFFFLFIFFHQFAIQFVLYFSLIKINEIVQMLFSNKIFLANFIKFPYKNMFDVRLRCLQTIYIAMNFSILFLVFEIFDHVSWEIVFIDVHEAGKTLFHSHK